MPKRAPIRTVAPVVLGLVGLVHAGTAGATPNLFLQLDVDGAVSSDSNGGMSTPSGPLVDTLDLTDATGESFAHAQTDYGVLSGGVSVAFTLTDTAVGGTTYGAAALVNFRDDFTITTTDPALDGQLGMMTFSISFDGSLAAMEDPDPLGLINGSAQWQGLVSTDFGQANFGGSLDSDGNSGGDPFGSQTVTLPFLFNLPSQLFVRFQGQANAFMTGRPAAGTTLTTTASMDFSNTVTWGGIQTVTDEFGDPVPFSLSSASGVDWTQPVPEPHTGALVALGLLGLATLGRKSPVA